MSAAVKINRLGKFDLNPRGNLWAKDESRFGHKLLSKMGWSQGKGLGKNEDGIKENLKVRMNSENAGIGWKEKFPLSVETDEYEAILANLNKKYNNSANKKSNEENETISIVKRSQEFKNRLHYGKFVRGKDVGRYSDKDFNSIFVSKMPKSESKPVVESKITNVECPDETPESTTFKSSLSMQEYFEMKMKKKAETTASNATASENKELAAENVSDKKKNKKKKHKLISEESSCEGNFEDINQEVVEVESNAEEQTLKRKKSKSLVKSKKIKLDPDLEENCLNGKKKDNEDLFEVITLDDSTVVNKTEKKKKQKKNSDKAKQVNLNSELDKKSLNTRVEPDTSCVEASESEIVILEDDVSFIDIEKDESSEVIDKTVKKARKRKKSKLNLTEDLSDDSTSSSSSSNEKEHRTDSAKDSTLSEEQSVSKRKKLKAKRSQKLSTSIMEGLKTCLRTAQTYSVQKEARRVSFSEQVHCRLLTTLLEDEETEVKSEINDIVLPYADKAEVEVEEVDESTAENETTTEKNTEETTEREESPETVEDVEDEEATPNCLILPKTDNSNYNSWLDNQRIASKMKVYKSMVKKIKKNPILKTTNLLDIKGYGNWGF